MTDDQWLTCTDPRLLLDVCQAQHRKLRLFACACARCVWHELPEHPFHTAVKLAEQVADDPLYFNFQRHFLRDECVSNENASRWTEAATSCLDPDAYSAAWHGSRASTAGAHNSPEWHADRAKQADLLREIFGNPLRPLRVEAEWLAWNNRTVPQIAARIYETNALHDLPVLADAIEEAGCTSAELLAHLRRPGGHVRGCWALDLLRDEPI